MNYMQLAKNVRKADEWIDELITWENAHPEYQLFKEEKDSYRRLHVKDAKEIS